MTHRIYILLLLLFFSLTSFSQTVIINYDCQKAYDNILALRFKEAKVILEREKDQNPNNVFIYYLENYIDFLTVTVSEDDEKYKELENNIGIRIDKIKELPDNSPYKYYFLGNINLQWATINLRFRNYTTGALQINRAYRMLEQNSDDFPDFYPNKITLGVLHIMLGIVPDSYRWLLNLLSMSGTVQQGRSELIFALEKCETDDEFGYLSSEILFYMGMIDLNLSSNPEYAEYILGKIDTLSSNNLLLTYLKINILMKNGRNDLALTAFESIDSSYYYQPFHYLNFLRGECYLRKLDSEKAGYNFSAYLNKFKGNNYLKNAWLKKGWCHLLSGDTLGYYKCLEEIPNYGKDDLDADMLAEQIYEEKLMPNVELLKAQLLFDGGYFDGADSVLRSINTNELSTEELVEKYYRSARIAHSDNRLDDAIGSYITTINKGSNLPQYYAANSALKLGNIFEIKSDTTSAIKYYEVCLELDFDQYRNSIRGKAKQGLNRLRQ